MLKVSVIYFYSLTFFLLKFLNEEKNRIFLQKRCIHMKLYETMLKQEFFYYFLIFLLSKRNRNKGQSFFSSILKIDLAKKEED